jgi:hypothetical protein
MSNNVEIRLIRYNELRKLLNLYVHFENGDPVLEDSDFLVKMWDDIFNTPNFHYIVADKDGELVSTCNITIIKNLTRMPGRMELLKMW